MRATRPLISHNASMAHANAHKMMMLAACSTPQRGYMIQWLPKYRDIARPSYYDNPMRRWDSAVKSKKFNYFSADPLHFDHHKEHINGGIQVVSFFKLTCSYTANESNLTIDLVSCSISIWTTVTTSQSTTCP